MAIVYRRNGVEMTREELLNRSVLHGGIQEICDSRKPPGGHECYWGTGHESVSGGVPAIQAKEHHEWMQKMGLSGVEVLADGTIKTSSPGARAAYLKARGLVDAGTAGSGEMKGTSTDQSPNRKRRRQPTDRKAIREQTTQILNSPEARAILGR